MILVLQHSPLPLIGPKMYDQYLNSILRGASGILKFDKVTCISRPLFGGGVAVVENCPDRDIATQPSHFPGLLK